MENIQLTIGLAGWALIILVVFCFPYLFITSYINTGLQAA